MATHARRLAEWLASHHDDALARLFDSRGVPSGVRWKDFFDAAEALLHEASIARVLPSLTRQEAAMLTGLEAHPAAVERLRALALLDDEDHPYPPVAVAVAGRAVPPELREAQAAAASDDAEAHAAERAFTHVGALADVLLATRDAPIATLTTGAAGAAERRRFADADIIPAGADLDELIMLATHSGLAAVEDRMLRITDDGEDWLRHGAAERWARLAEGLRAALPRGIRSENGGLTPPMTWLSAFPWDPDWPAQCAAIQRRAVLLGIYAEEMGTLTEPVWTGPLREGRPADPAALQRLLPAEVDKIFLQNDLSAIAPGPLAAALDVRLRAAAVRESASQASSYRFTAESVAHALALGETEESLLAFLEELSLTGIPQPLRYLIGQTAARHGLVQVTADAAGTRIRSGDAHLLGAISVDQSLRPLGLIRDGDALRTRASPVTAYWALSDARYPATLIGPDGHPVVAGRHPAATAPADAPPETTYGPLIARLREAHGDDADAAWLERVLESAVQSRAAMIVEVALPDGSTRELTLEVTGFGGGRVRGKDRAADVERTLPVSSIRSLRAAG